MSADEASALLPSLECADKDGWAIVNRRRLLGAASLLWGALVVPATAQTPNRISLSRLEEMFSEMRAKSGWNVDGPMLWGYFFIDTSRGKLTMLSERLQVDGYRLVGIHPRADSAILHQLHVERVEVHSPQSLHKRNAELYALAEQFQVTSYDGMDVGPASAAGK